MDKVKAPNVYIQNIDNTIGRGVFANQIFKMDDIVELAPVFIIEKSYSEIPKPFKIECLDGD